VQRDEVFSIRFSKKYGISLDKVLPFFKNEFQKCLVGKADLKVELKKYFPDWGYKGTVDDLLNFWFLGENKVDNKILQIVSMLRKKGVKVYLATNNEKYRVRYLSEVVGLANQFDGIYSSAFLGIKKPDVKFFEKILKDLNVKDASSVYFCDNDNENIEGAKAAGLQTHFYKNFSKFRYWIEKI